jgi:hypothetical protein
MAQPRRRTGRFIPCPAMLWRHPEDRNAYEIWRSEKIKNGQLRVYYYYRCGACDPVGQYFLNDWSDSSGYTIVEAEAAGFKPKVSPERKADLLKELGLQQMTPPPPLHPAGPWPMPAPLPPPHYVPRRPPGASSNPKQK